MKLISWNVNGLRAIVKKDFFRDIQALDPDILCLQETKMQKNQYDIDLPGYQSYWNAADKKGYSGTAVFSRIPFLNVTYGIGIDEHDHEGRVITCETEDFFLVCCYTPNAQKELARIEYRMRWENDFRDYLIRMDRVKPVVLCGDLNVAHEEIDLKNPSTNHKSAGFSDQERAQFGSLLGSGFIDSFRYFYPTATGAYSWWSYIGAARTRNAGWRIDYFVVSERLKGRMIDAKIHSDVMGSDHCPVELTLQSDVSSVKSV